MANKPEVLYISYDGLTDPLGQSQIIPYMQGLAQTGYGIHILSCEKKERFAEQKKQIEEILSKSNIYWHPVPYTHKPPVLSTVYDIRHLKSVAWKLNKKYHFSIVHCRSYITAFVGMYLKRKTGAKFIFDMRGFFADERVEGGLWSLQNPVYRAVYNYFKRKEKEFLINSDYTVTLTEKAKTEIREHFSLGEKTPKIEVIPCCADTDFFSTARVSEKEKNDLAHQLSILPGDMIISYSGSVGTWYMPDEMLDFFKELSNTYANAKFLIITHDNPQKIVEATARKNIDREKIIITKSLRWQMPLFLSLSHIALFFIKPVYSKMASSPTKMGEIMSMGIPFIANSGVGDMDLFVEKTGNGLLVKNFTSESYLDVIKKIPDLLRLDPAVIRTKAMEEYSLNHGIAVYQKIYEHLTQ